MSTKRRRVTVELMSAEEARRRDEVDRDVLAMSPVERLRLVFWLSQMQWSGDGDSGARIQRDVVRLGPREG